MFVSILLVASIILLRFSILSILLNKPYLSNIPKKEFIKSKVRRVQWTRNWTFSKNLLAWNLSIYIFPYYISMMQRRTILLKKSFLRNSYAVLRKQNMGSILVRFSPVTFSISKTMRSLLRNWILCTILLWKNNIAGIHILGFGFSSASPTILFAHPCAKR